MPESPPIRPAATVVVLAGAPGDLPRLVMVRRSARSRFMPSTYVFPGGRVEPEDGKGDAAFLHAAIRECQEEVGLSLERDALVWFDTWITPSAERRRYHARFFAAFVDTSAVTGLAADGLETFDLRCETAEAMLASWRASRADLPPPTLATLLRLAGRTTAEIRRWMEDVDPGQPILPKWIQRDGLHHVFLPHAPGYTDLEGDGARAPARVASLPIGFVRKEDRWHPIDG
ncbi:MAG: NUDIX domain-containing protein [Deltaproteobacteria bacterium]|nr:MAG: NUDIX domain-containing protein [Deltaproteobacteria bacterium]